MATKKLIITWTDGTTSTYKVDTGSTDCPYKETETKLKFWGVLGTGIWGCHTIILANVRAFELTGELADDSV